MTASRIAEIEARLGAVTPAYWVAPGFVEMAQLGILVSEHTRDEILSALRASEARADGMAKVVEAARLCVGKADRDGVYFIQGGHRRIALWDALASLKADK